MPEPYTDTLATVAAGRAAAVAELRQLAAALEALPLAAAAEVLVLLEPVLDDLRRQAALALDHTRPRAPADQQRATRYPARSTDAHTGTPGGSGRRVPRRNCDRSARAPARARRTAHTARVGW